MKENYISGSVRLLPQSRLRRWLLNGRDYEAAYMTGQSVFAVRWHVQPPPPNNPNSIFLMDRHDFALLVRRAMTATKLARFMALDRDGEMPPDSWEGTLQEWDADRAEQSRRYAKIKKGTDYLCIGFVKGDEVLTSADCLYVEPGERHPDHVKLLSHLYAVNDEQDVCFDGVGFGEGRDWRPVVFPRITVIDSEPVPLLPHKPAQPRPRFENEQEYNTQIPSVAARWLDIPNLNIKTSAKTPKGIARFRARMRELYAERKRIYDKGNDALHRAGFFTHTNSIHGIVDERPTCVRCGSSFFCQSPRRSKFCYDCGFKHVYEFEQDAPPPAPASDEDETQQYTRLDSYPLASPRMSADNFVKTLLRDGFHAFVHRWRSDEKRRIAASLWAQLVWGWLPRDLVQLGWSDTDETALRIRADRFLRESKSVPMPKPTAPKVVRLPADRWEQEQLKLRDGSVILLPPVRKPMRLSSFQSPKMPHQSVKYHAQLMPSEPTELIPSKMPALLYRGDDEQVKAYVTDKHTMSRRVL